MKIRFLYLHIFVLVISIHLAIFSEKHDYVMDLSKGVDLSPAVACLIVDLKYDGSGIKIFEFGNITMSVLAGHRKLYGTGEIWGALWKYLKSYQLPVWFVSPRPGRILASERCFDMLHSFGVQYKREVGFLLRDKCFLEALDDTQDLGRPKRVESCNSIVVLKGKVNRRRGRDKRFKQTVILNKYIHKYATNKYNMALLFDDELSCFRPQWNVYPQRYTANLADEIKSDFCDYDQLVIKPINSTMGRGVIMLEKKDLERTLQMIFKEKDKIGKKADSSYSYWKKRANGTFLVESLEQSKYITVENKKYDATMRVVFVLCCSDDKVGIKFLGSYWKLPKVSVEDSDDLQETHKSKIRRGATSSVKVSKEDMEHVEELLAQALLPMYEKVLKKEQR